MYVCLLYFSHLQDIGIDVDIDALDNANILSTFVEAYIQELGLSGEEEEEEGGETVDIESRRRNVTAILLALFGWSVSDCPGRNHTNE